MHRRRVVGLLASAAMLGVGVFNPKPVEAQEPTAPDHVAWVAEVLKRMQTIKPGTTRKALLTVFKTEGGLSTPLQRTFVSRDCPYFKVNVEFHAVGRPERDVEGRVTMDEGDEDVIVKVSVPYLEFSVMD